MTAIRGTTAEDRVAARRKRTAERRAQHYLALMLAAAASRKPHQQLQHATDYVRAVGNDLRDPAQLAQQITQIADRWNQNDYGQ